MKTFYFTVIFVLTCVAPGIISAQTVVDSGAVKAIIEPAKKKHWYDVIEFGGYTHMRYNRLLETNENLKCEQCDKSWGEGGSIFFRRARIKFSGNVHERVYAYIQLDLASNISSAAAGTNWNYAQLRDLYFDIALDKKKEFRLRPGLSKIPFGFENLQSSQNRIDLDRSDAINSASPNERDMGLFFYWAPAKIRSRFKELQNAVLKGTGDYGVFALGLYNGQSANKPDLNDNLHIVSRLTYPIKLKNGQFLESSVFAYTGHANMKELKASATKVKNGGNYKDQRIGASITIYPQPFGFQAEYNIGKGPEFTKGDTSIQVKNLKGGYVKALYRIKIKNNILFPYARYQYYHGGKKQEADARSYEVKELEIGIEWQPISALEITAAYVISDRTFEDSKLPFNNQTGSLLRLQAQFNY